MIVVWARMYIAVRGMLTRDARGRIAVDGVALEPACGVAPELVGRRVRAYGRRAADGPLQAQGVDALLAGDRDLALEVRANVRMRSPGPDDAIVFLLAEERACVVHAVHSNGRCRAGRHLYEYERVHGPAGEVDASAELRLPALVGAGTFAVHAWNKRWLTRAECTVAWDGTGWTIDGATVPERAQLRIQLAQSKSSWAVRGRGV